MGIIDRITNNFLANFAQFLNQILSYAQLSLHDSLFFTLDS